MMSYPTDFQRVYGQRRLFFENRYTDVLAKSSYSNAPVLIKEAVFYSLSAKGKRFRPVILLEVAHQLKLSSSVALSMALSVECMHSYSLIHDDLPALDNDDLRRGRPASHKKFSEDIAILAGDALQTLSFEIMTMSKSSNNSKLVAWLAKSAGAAGMVGGQVLDMSAQKNHSKRYLEKMHRLKTGELFGCCLALPFIAVAASSSKIKLVAEWGRDVGLLFQITDDILDATMATSALGKSAGKDKAAGKLTFVNFYGLEKCKSLAAEKANALIKKAGNLFKGSIFLQKLPQEILERQS